MMRCSTLLLSLSLVLTACGDEGANSDRSKRSSKKDRGEAAMSIGGTPWSASSAKATLRGTSLTIKASANQIDSGKVSRQELHLQIADYQGPGDYKTGHMGSRFIGVGINSKAAAANDDAAATNAVMDTLSKAKHMMLTGVNVKVTSATDSEIRGTFSWQPPEGTDNPKLEDGTFRALIRK